MKKIFVTLSIIGIIVCSLAAMSSARSEVINMGLDNRYNGSYYYDIGWAKVNVQGATAATNVDVMIKKNGKWIARKVTRVKGSRNGNTMTCYSYQVQGRGANSVSVTRIDL